MFALYLLFLCLIEGGFFAHYNLVKGRAKDSTNKVFWQSAGIVRIAKKIIKSLNVIDKRALNAYNSGQVLAYPTEAVFGLGCDPDNEAAVNQLLAIKNRPVEKGLILLGSSFEQLSPYINTKQISAEQLDNILARWPNGITQVLHSK